MYFKNNTELLPAIIQDSSTKQVLMLGYMNQEAFEKTLETKQVTFWSRSKQRLWVKGETSHNYLHLQSISFDCDNDAILILAKPAGPTCHTGTTSCFYEDLPTQLIQKLYAIYEHLRDNNIEKSYTSKMLREKNVEFFEQRMHEEFKELEGVIKGEHVHSGDTVQDIILEGTQVWYWIALQYVSQKKEWQHVRDSAALKRLRLVVEAEGVSLDRLLWEDVRQMEGKGYIE